MQKTEISIITLSQYHYSLHNSVFTTTMNTLLYDEPTDLSTLLADIGITTCATSTIDLLEQIIIPKNDLDAHRKQIKKIGTPVILTILDKLAMPSPINAIIKLHIKLDKPSPVQIINHSLQENEMIAAYADKYNVLYNNHATLVTYDFAKAVKHGLRVKKVGGLGKRVCYISNIEERNARYNYNPKKCRPIKSILRELFCIDQQSRTDDGLSGCTTIEELDVTHEYEITTCAPFATSLRKLIANNNWTDSLQLRDNGLQSCTSITYLSVSGNNNITTCAPFAKSLRELHVRHGGGLCDEGISMCTLIEIFDVASNKYITTCAPFAKSLRELYISGNCGLRDEGISMCTSIKILDISSNPYITTCAPFGSSLRKLIACWNDRGISDAGLCSCTSLTYLNANYNSRITTCAPFAKTLKILFVSSNGGIFAPTCSMTDAGLSLCDAITLLNASGNNKITTCAPFAQTLTILIARGSCGITNRGISTCTSITHLYCADNDNITIKKCNTRIKLLD